MNLERLDPSQLRTLLLSQCPLIDVRAPVEFQQGHLPHAVNLPLLNDEERALIGTTYKKKGREAAVQLGYELIAGEVKAQRLSAWMKFLKKNPQAVLYCFRGGMRSQISQQWIHEAGISRPLLTGGYKRARQELLTSLQAHAQRKFLLLTGPTGSGKSQLLESVTPTYPSLHLEKIAHHRGSAFGAYEGPQPVQINFENELALRFWQLEESANARALLVEDESRLIGRLAIPALMFDQLRLSPVIWIVEELEARIENIFKDYILQSPIGLSLLSPSSDLEFGPEDSPALKVFARYENSLRAISKKLGGLRTQEIMADLLKSKEDWIQRKELASNREWIRKLLLAYYDPLYAASLARREVQIQFRGSWKACRDYIDSL